MREKIIACYSTTSGADNLANPKFKEWQKDLAEKISNREIISQHNQPFFSPKSVIACHEELKRTPPYKGDIFKDMILLPISFTKEDFILANMTLKFKARNEFIFFSIEGFEYHEGYGNIIFLRFKLKDISESFTEKDFLDFFDKWSKNPQTEK